MNRLEKTLSLVAIISLFIYLLVLHLGIGPNEYNFWLLILSPTAALVLNLVFLRNMTFSFIWITTLLFITVWLADIFKVLHLPAADILAIFSYLLYIPILGITFLSIGFNSPKSTKLYLLITGTLLVIQFLIPLTFASWNQNLPRMIINYALAATTFTSVIKYPSQKLFEKRLMILLFLYSLMNIINGIFK